MKGIILAGGLGTRLRPMTLKTNKHLLRIHDRPMIHFPIASLVGAGVTDILIVTGPSHLQQFKSALGTPSSLGVTTLAFAEQPREAGVADALRQGESFAAGDRVCVILGDNIIEQSIHDTAGRFRAQKSGARVLLKQSDTPERFGIARVENDRIVEVAEKPDPARGLGALAVIGIYFYDARVFEVCRNLKPSVRGELEISDVNNWYAARGELEWEMLNGWWADVGTPESLEEAARRIAQSTPQHDARSTA